MFDYRKKASRDGALIFLEGKKGRKPKKTQNYEPNIPDSRTKHS